MEFIERDGVGVFRSEILYDAGIVHGFTTKKIDGTYKGSISPRDIADNSESLKTFISAFNLDNHKLVFQKQVHGDNVKVIRKDNISDKITIIDSNDAMITSDSGVCLLSHSADCMSLIMAHPESGAVGIAHCGRKGVILNLPRKLTMRMCEEYSLMPSELFVVMGSTISVLCYEIGESVVKEILEINPDAFGFLIRRESRRFFDIRGYATHQLLNAGLLPEKMDSLNLCSHCHDEYFYSYRRDGESLGYQSGFVVGGKSDHE